MKRGVLVTALAIVVLGLAYVGNRVLNQEPQAAPAPAALHPDGDAALQEIPTRKAIELAPVPDRPPSMDEPAKNPATKKTAFTPSEPSKAANPETGLEDLARGGAQGPGPPGQVAPQTEAPFSGRVFAQDGSGARAKVTLVRQGGSWSKTTDDEGRFAFDSGQGGGESFAAGTYALVASTDGGETAVHEGIHWSPGSPLVNVDLTVEPGVTVAFQLTGTKQSARVRVLSGGLPIADFTLRNGTPATEILPATALLAQLYEGDMVFGEQTISGFPGGDVSIEFQADE